MICSFGDATTADLLETPLTTRARKFHPDLILAARVLGLDAGPIGGFDNAKVDAVFFPDGKWRSNFLLNLGYGDPAGLFPRSPRLDFAEACKIE